MMNTMEYFKYKMPMTNGLATTSGPESGIQLELQRLQLELQRRDTVIDEQQKRIYQLEDELKRGNKQIQELVLQLSTLKEQKKSETGYKPAQSRYWTAEEHDRFLDAVKRYGSKDVKAIANYVGTRNPTQVRTHAQKYYLRLERERKRKEDDDKGEKTNGDDSDSKRDGEDSGKDSIDGIATPTSDEDNKDIASQPSTSNVPSPNSSSSADNLTKKAPGRKRAASTGAGRRASLPAEMLMTKSESFSNTPSTASPANPTIVHSTRQQLQAAAPIVSSLKGWTPEEYNLFIEGLLSFPEEKDINRKCKLISEKFLPKYSPEDIKQCYAILHNYVRNKESVGQDESVTTTFLPPETPKRPRIEPINTYTAPAYAAPVPEQMMRYPSPYGYPPGVMRPYGYVHPYASVPMSPYAGMDPAMQAYMSASSGYPPEALRRASYPMDNTFAKNVSEYPEYAENVFPPEIPTNWGSSSEGQPTTTSATTEATTRESTN